jgi:hypothetical protein
MAFRRAFLFLTSPKHNVRYYETRLYPQTEYVPDRIFLPGVQAAIGKPNGLVVWLAGRMSVFFMTPADPLQPFM